MGVFCDILNLCSTVALNCRTGKNKDRYWKKELSFLLVSLVLLNQHQVISATVFTRKFLIFHNFKLTIPNLHYCITHFCNGRLFSELY